ncbi:ROK family protein [Flammeovirga pectinis]|uniref:ROK family protein n=1 Tax=Flammeovirga pectinis TaxID=2494373 RepID=A0A3Q9FS17_9BACT|nr:ROK family protein [Flammeovirga pectinis]AZQ63866.1 ROK family protein [Flammeovirga pectinis]
MSNFILTADIGGSHITTAVVDFTTKKVVKSTVYHKVINSNATDGNVIISDWLAAFKNSLQAFTNPIEGIGIAMPGPFNYTLGISEIKGVGKYESIFGWNIRLALYTALKEYLSTPNDIQFINDADAFILGAVHAKKWDNERVVGITLGTGYGSGFVDNGKMVTTGNEVPEEGKLHFVPFKEGINEDYISTRWFTKEWQKRVGENIKGVKEIVQANNETSKQLFDEFGNNLSATLAPWCTTFKPTKMIIGGNITKAMSLFDTPIKNNLNIDDIVAYAETEEASMIGAASNFIKTKSTNMTRNTKQYLMPSSVQKTEKGAYDIYPSHTLKEGEIKTGYQSLAGELKQYSTLLLEGYVGVAWETVTTQLLEAFKGEGIEKIQFVNINAALKSEEEINKITAPYLGGDDPIFGKLFEGKLIDFFDKQKVDAVTVDKNVLTVIYGCGASLLKVEGAKVVYLDVPKNEIQFRSRAGGVINIGAKESIAAKPQYKRMYFIDWVILNNQKAAILPKIDYIIDEQRSDAITWTDGVSFRKGLEEMSNNAFRVRPWFEPGAWGGQWIKEKIGGLAEDVPNYAWSFELIVPENGIVFEQNGALLEVSFDFLMYYNNKNVLGEASDRFGYEFPIRFDFLDTIQGGNLSVQCHPTVPYMQKNFGHKFTQDETYYMLDAKEDAKVYLGFQEDIEPEKFRAALTHSFENSEELAIENYVQVHPAKKHDLFLIPNGTIHCSGTDGMVLEISATPYIFTFKMYDWLRLDLDGKPRPMNIERGMENLNFDRKGAKVQEELISTPEVLKEGKDYKIVNLPTHKEHFYAIERFEFDHGIEVQLKNQCHVMSLVEGESITVETNGNSFDINYAETFVVPAASGSYKLINTSGRRVKVINSYVKSEEC